MATHTQSDYETFRNAFFALFTEPRFGNGQDFLSYLRLPKSERSGDEASIVDSVIVAPLLGLLGFSESERVYNEQKTVSHRPDFTPRDTVYGDCFVVEDKATVIPLSTDLNDTESTLSQLRRYARALAVRLGIMTNGQQLYLYDFRYFDSPECLAQLDIPAALQNWEQTGQTYLDSDHNQALKILFDRCLKDHFTMQTRLEKDIALDEHAWEEQALKLGEGNGAESVLVETVRILMSELQREGRLLLDHHLNQVVAFEKKRPFFHDSDNEPGYTQLVTLRERVKGFFTRNQTVFGLKDEEIEHFTFILKQIEEDPITYPDYQTITTAFLEPLNAARERQSINRSRSLAPLKDLDTAPFVDLRDMLKAYIEKVWQWHQRQASLRQTYRTSLQVQDDYQTWKTLVKETMLGGLDESQRRDEFALQAAYVIFIRLLIIRVCEDKKIFPNRLLSDGGIVHWQACIERYFFFTNGDTNTYAPLLEIAYENAQNIYAQFFTRRELFNWFRLNQRQLIKALHQLNRFNFAAVNSDIIGTIYNTYVGRKEKRDKGQYYTPPEIVHYMLDNVGYTAPTIMGADKRLIDPACGSGSFLVTAARRLVEAYTASGIAHEDPVAVLHRVHDALYGFDLNPFACYLAEVNLLIQVLDLVKLAHDRGKYPRLQPFHIYNTDALEKSQLVNYYAHFNPELAEEQQRVAAIKERTPKTPYEAGFAFVVANPPYGATLSDLYKARLREDWADLFYGQPDTYTFFLGLGAMLLAQQGRLAFITPNTYLMGTNTKVLRQRLLQTGCIEQIVDLPQGIWGDANVDCTLFFLREESDEQQRRTHTIHVHILGMKDHLDLLTQRQWQKTYVHRQATWIDHAQAAFSIQHDALLQHIENACIVQQQDTKQVLRLDDITDSSQGIIPYKTKEEGKQNRFIKPEREVIQETIPWKPLLDSSCFVGRYELRWHHAHPHLHYGDHLWTAVKPRFFESPKLLFIRLRNRALSRRLVATYDDKKFYNRHNFSNIIQSHPEYPLKYILALFNSALLNYWYAQQFASVEIAIANVRQLPIYPASSEQQQPLIDLADKLLERHSKLNEKRTQGSTIQRKRDGTIEIDIPYDILLQQVRSEQSHYPTMTLFDARATGQVMIERKTPDVTHTGRAFIPSRYPTNVVVRHQQFWFTVPDEDLRTYLQGILDDSRWHGATWDDLKDTVMIPDGQDALTMFFQQEQQERAEIETLFAEVAALDREIDEQVLDLYHITDPTDRQRVLGSVAQVDENGQEIDEEQDAVANE